MPGGQLLLVEERAQLKKNKQKKQNSPIKWAKKPPTTRKSTAKLSQHYKGPSQARTSTLPDVRDREFKTQCFFLSAIGGPILDLNVASCFMHYNDEWWAGR